MSLGGHTISYSLNVDHLTNYRSIPHSTSTALLHIIHISLVTWKYMLLWR